MKTRLCPAGITLALAAVLTAFPLGYKSPGRSDGRYNETTIEVPYVDPVTGKHGVQKLTYWRGGSAADNPALPGGAGKTLTRTGSRRDADVFAMDPLHPGSLSPAINVAQVQCGSEHLISRTFHDTNPGANCGGPAAMANRATIVEQECLAKAVDAQDVGKDALHPVQLVGARRLRCRDQTSPEFHRRSY